MQIKFLTTSSPGRGMAELHIKDIYARSYGAKLDSFAPLIAAVFNGSNQVVCAAGIRTSDDGFFSDSYLTAGFSETLRKKAGLDIKDHEIMEVTSLASASPFPVLPLLDTVIDWGRQQGITCGVFTATRPLRRLLRHAKLAYTPLCAANPNRISNPALWGSYYDSDPWVCAFAENEKTRAILTPDRRDISQKEAI
ncbi:MAG: thermostable hemolysin [Ruegeria sp.]